jgi:hypothetical protein
MTPGTEMVGRIVLVEPAMQMVEIVVFSRLLDIAMSESLDMEGGRTGRHGMFKPSTMRRESSL